MPPGQFRGLEAFFTRLFRPYFRLSRGSSYQTATVRLHIYYAYYAIYPKPNLSKNDGKAGIVPYLLRYKTALFPALP